jgi:hypothetical protein
MKVLAIIPIYPNTPVDGVLRATEALLNQHDARVLSGVYTTNIGALCNALCQLPNKNFEKIVVAGCGFGAGDKVDTACPSMRLTDGTALQPGHLAAAKLAPCEVIWITARSNSNASNNAASCVKPVPHKDDDFAVKWATVKERGWMFVPSEHIVEESTKHVEALPRVTELLALNMP